MHKDLSRSGCVPLEPRKHSWTVIHFRNREGEFHDLLVHADKLPGLGEALQGVLDRYMLTWSMWKCLISAEHLKWRRASESALEVFVLPELVPYLIAMKHFSICASVNSNGSWVILYLEDAIVLSQCPPKMRPLFKCILKKYPTSGMLAPAAAYASGALPRLIRAQDRAISGTRKRALAEAFPRSTQWFRAADGRSCPQICCHCWRYWSAYPTQCPEVSHQWISHYKY